MKLALLFFLLLGVNILAFAQVGNEWIQYDQSYYKIPTGTNGIYRLTYSDLQTSGIPVASMDPKKIQLFHRGVEQAIFVEGESDNQFDPSDFIEFYGQKNDGTLDAGLYKPASAQMHNYYNLYSDTTAYFLTVGSIDGKRITVFDEDNSDNLAAELYHNEVNLLLYSHEYATGVDYGSILNTYFDVGEGWTSGRIFQNQFYDNVMSGFVQAVPAGGVPELEIQLLGRGVMAHQVEISVGPTLRLLTTHNFSGFQHQNLNFPLQWSDIDNDGKLTVRVRVNGVGGQPDRVSIGYIKVRYPQRFDAAAASPKIFTLPVNAGNKTFIQIENPQPSLRLFDVTDADNVSRIDGTLSTTFDAIVPGTASERKIFASSTTITPVIKPISFRRIIPADHDYIIIGHPLLRQPALGYSDPIEAYGAYRASPEGGSYDTLVVNIQQLYNQFSYGENTPLAIYNFLKYLTNSTLPKYLLLVGKGLDVTYKYYRNPSGFTTFKDLIPSSGYPGSDMAFSAGLSGTDYEPAIPTGRIPATNAEHVAAYLNKVKEMESLPFDNLWRKNVLHLSGGREQGEPELLRAYLEDLQGEAEGLYLGGKVSALAKYSKDIQLVNVSKQVNEGVNLITFFGHSSATNLDFDIGYVTNPVMGYSNKGKYPTLLMNGCNVGAYFLTYSTFGEDWVLARDKGATAFIAHSSYGFTNLLKRYADHFYDVGYQDSTFIYKGIGDIQKEAARKYMSTTVASPPNTTQVQQMILLGDPAVKLFGAPKADLSITNDHVSIQSLDGQPITSLTEAFGIKMIVNNFGQAKPDTIRIEVERKLNDNSIITYDSLFAATKYSDTLLFIIKKGREQGGGTNSFKITLDPDNVLPELLKTNNTVTKDFVIPLNGTKNLYPINYGIVNRAEVGFSFQATDLLSDEREFIFELDTVHTFDSQYKITTIVTAKILARHNLSLLNAADTLAFYWRTKLANPLPGESVEWTESSFTYIHDGPEGWAQVHFPQYLQNETVGLIKDIDSRRINFKETVTTVDIRTFGSNHPSLNTDVNIKINNEEYNLTQQGFICRDNSLGLIAFDKNSAAAYIGVQFKWYNRANRACGREPWIINNYVPGDMVTGDGFDLIQFVNNVQDGDSVVLFNIGDAQYSAWPMVAKTKLGELGISVAQIDALTPGEPIVIFARKGLAPGAATIFKSTSAPADVQELSVSKSITGGYSSGTLHSGLIGPASYWQSFSAKHSEQEGVDILSYDIMGVTLSGEEDLLMAEVTGEQDLTTLDANVYPYIKVVFKVTDDTNLTSPQLNHWIVSYTPVPDGLLIFNGSKEQQVLNEGESWRGEYGFINITDKQFSDSLTIHSEVFNQPMRSAEAGQFKIKAPLPGDTTKFQLNISTLNKGGVNDVNVYVNPKVIPEQYYDNNVLQLPDYLLVNEESFHPVLDVAIDGRYIENMDFVSSNPFIHIKVWDENKHVLKIDTTGMKVYLTYPCDTEFCDPTPILLTDAQIQWHPATEDSPFRIEFRPIGLSNGVYTLRVEAQDARANSSGAEPYEIQFTVNSETSVTISEPYPNPFSQDVYFRVVISGNDLPDAFDMRLIHVNGKEIGHFGNYSNPPMHIGTNELSWDGKDPAGNTLPSGVYIYKMMLYIKDRVVEKIGKVVLVRGQ